ncbi:hypothetical protein P3L10_005577 [Capsicum annuum]
MNIAILLRYSDKWRSQTEYVDYKSEGIVVAESVNYLRLISSISDELKLTKLGKILMYVMLSTAMIHLFISVTIIMYDCMSSWRKLNRQSYIKYYSRSNLETNTCCRQKQNPVFLAENLLTVLERSESKEIP